MVVALVLVPCAAAQDGMVHKNGTPSDSAGSMHYRIYRPSGEQIDFETMAAEVYRADAVLVGEEHDDPIAHFLQAKLLRAVHEKRLADGDSVGAVVLTLEMGLISPPVGVNVFIVKSVAPNVDLNTIFRGVVPFWLAMIVTLVILVLFPQISLYLPDTMIN